MILEDFHKKISDKFGDNDKSRNILAFYISLDRFGIEDIKKIYSQSLIDEYLSCIDDISIFKNNFEVSEVDTNEILQNISIQSLIYFVKYVQTGFNLKKTSQLLSISHQGLTKSISNIEKNYKVKLIERNKDVKILTIQGKILFEKSIEINCLAKI